MRIKGLYRFFKSVVNNGHNNVVNIGSKMRHSKIRINGNNNSIIIGRDCIIRNANIIINGDNNRLIIRDTARLLGGCSIFLDGDATLQIGKNAGIRKVDFLAKDAMIDIGELCMFSNNIIVRTHDSHKVLDNESGAMVNSPKNVVLGKHVWIGQNVTILKGVEIGDDSVLAFGSVITKSCPSNCIMAGNPAKIVKQGITWDY